MVLYSRVPAQQLSSSKLLEAVQIPEYSYTGDGGAVVSEAALLPDSSWLESSVGKIISYDLFDGKLALAYLGARNLDRH